MLLPCKLRICGWLTAFCLLLPALLLSGCISQNGFSKYYHDYTGGSTNPADLVWPYLSV